MPRALGNQLVGRPGLAGAVIVLGLLSLLPTSSLRWVEWLHNPVMTVLAPIQSTIRSATVWVHPVPDVSSNKELEQMRAYAADLNAQYLRAKLEIDDLRNRIREISRAIDLNPTLPVRTIMAPIIGPGADLAGGLVTVKAGKREGVEVNSVATVRGVYLFGRVRSAGERTCEVLPITFLPRKRNPEVIGAAIMLDEQKVGPRCDLVPTGEGTLVGKLQDDVDPNAPTQMLPGPGMTVRLVDPAWPASAQMLIIGTVDRIDPAPDQPLRKLITVRPVYGLDRWSEVMIRITESAASASPPPASPTLPAPAPSKPSATKGGKP
jgi:hypothetical protein